MELLHLDLIVLTDETEIVDSTSDKAGIVRDVAASPQGQSARTYLK